MKRVIHSSRQTLRWYGALGLVVLAAILADPDARAYAAWCAMYPSGGTNCSFDTHGQCLATISGVGGHCSPSPERPTVRAEPERARRESPTRIKRETQPRSTARAMRPAAPIPSAPRAVSNPPTVQPLAPRQELDFASARELVLQGQYAAGIMAMRTLKFDDHPDVAAFVGFAYRKLGRLDDARVWYERALAADPDHKLTLSFYGMMRAELGDINRARVDLERLKLICGDTSCDEYQALQGVITATERR
jgi:tetratricopeptide (TPR) repeat protein